jgi:hypothetical protein
MRSFHFLEHEQFFLFSDAFTTFRLMVVKSLNKILLCVVNIAITHCRCQLTH